MKLNWQRLAKMLAPLVVVLTLSQPALAAPIELALDDSIALALKNNPTIKMAEYDREKADWAVKQAEAGKGLTIGFTHSDSRYNSPSSTSGNGYAYTTQFSNELALNQPLYSGGKLEAQVDQAQINLKISDLSLEATRQQLRLNATIAYFNVLESRNLLEVNNQSVADFAAHLKNVQAQYAIGTVAKTDVLQTEVQLANAQDSLIKAQNNYDLAIANFNNVVGLPLDSEIRLQEASKYEKYPLTLGDSVKYALTNRPEMATAQAGIVSAEDQVKIARSGNLPSLGLSASNGWAAPDFPGTKNSNWMISLQASLNLFDSGLTRSQVKEAESVVAKSKEQVRQTTDNIALAVRQAYLNMQEAEKRIDTSNVAVDKADEDFKIAQVRYGAGVGTNLDVVDSELALIQAKTNYIQALYDYNTGRAQLDQAMGVPVK